LTAVEIVEFGRAALTSGAAAERVEAVRSKTSRSSERRQPRPVRDEVAGAEPGQHLPASEAPPAPHGMRFALVALLGHPTSAFRVDGSPFASDRTDVMTRCRQ
jgi:hypothetical protein